MSMIRFANTVRRPRPEGFTLVEMAIVLIIVALLLGGLMTPLSARIDQRNYNETKQQIDEIRNALIGFAVANGRLPRPATSITNGEEATATCSDDGACTGFIPWATLGVKRTDAWNKMLRYSVSPNFANGPFALATPATKKVTSRDAAGNVIYLVGSASSCNPCSPAVIYSAGKNNWGISDDGTALADGSTTNADEDANASATTQFFAREQSTTSTASTGGEFDDLVSWIPPYVLFDRMISASKLP